MSRLLEIYLNDHLAGATLGTELVERARRNNAGTELGSFLERVAAEIREDRATLEDVMHRVGARRSRVKPALAYALERVGRLKPNGRVRSYSPLSRLLELEGLAVGVVGKLALWRALERLADPRLADVDFPALCERASRQRDELEERRLAASRLALTSD